MIYSERVISSGDKLPLLVEDALDELPGNSLLLDIGAGNGRLGNVVSRSRPDIRVVGVEYDAALALDGMAPLRDSLVIADAKSLPFGSEVVDVVATINTLHEVVNALTKRKGCHNWILLSQVWHE